MRRIIRIFAGALITLAILSVALLIYLSVADLSRYEEQIETFISERSGLQLRIDGRFNFDFGRITTLIADDVSLSNPVWPGEAELIRIGHLEVSVHTWSIISTPLRIENLDVENVRGTIAYDSEGRLNWLPGPLKTREPGSPAFDLNRVAFRQVKIDNVEVTYENPMRPRPLQVKIRELAVAPDQDDILDLEIEGSVNGLALLADGKLGPWRNFAVGRDVFTDLDVTLGSLDASVDGTLEDIPHLEGIDLDGALSGSDLGQVLESLDLPPFADGELQLSASVHQAGDDHAVRLEGTFGEVSLSAHGVVDSLLLPRHSAYDFRLDGPNARHVAELFGMQRLPERPFHVAGKYSRDESLLGFEDVVLEIDANSLRFGAAIDLASLDVTANLTAEGPDFSVFAPILHVNELPKERFEVAGRVAREGAVWEADGVEMTIGDNLIFANGRVRAGSSDAEEIRLTLDGPDISILRGFTPFAGIPTQPYDLDIVVRSHPDGLEIVEGTGVFGEYRLQASGLLKLGQGLSGTQGTVRVVGPELHSLYSNPVMEHLPPLPFDVTGEVEIDDDALLIRNATGSAGSIDARADGQIGLSGNAGNFQLDISLQGPDASSLSETDWFSRLNDEPYRISGAISRENKTLSARNLDVSIANLEATVNGSMMGGAQGLEVELVARADDARLIQKWADLGQLPEGEMSASGRVSRVDDTLEFSNARLDIADLHAFANGRLHLEPMQNDSDLEFSLAGQNLDEAGRLVDVAGLPDENFEISGRFKGNPTGFQVDDLSAKLGDADLVGHLSANLEGKPRLAGSLSSSYIDISDPINRGKVARAESADDEKTDKDRIFPDDPLADTWLGKFDLDLKIRIDQLIANAIRVSNVDVGIVLQDGGLRVEPFHLEDGTGSVDAFLSLLPEQGTYSMQSRLDVEGIHLGLLAEEDQDRTTLPMFRGGIEIAGKGASIRAIMGASNGNIALQQGPGRVREIVGIGIFKDVVVQSLRTLVPPRESGHQNMDCGFYDATIEDGVLTIDRIALQTRAIQLVASGRIRLQSERIDMTFRAKPRQGLGVSLGTVANSFLAIGGTLSHPSVSFDPARSATTTGAAVATGGLSLLARGLWDRLTAQANICKELER